jgi:hypothetical protein
MAYLCNMTDVAYQCSKERILTKNSHNGYALISCIVMDKKDPYCILRSWYKPL